MVSALSGSDSALFRISYQEICRPPFSTGNGGLLAFRSQLFDHNPVVELTNVIRPVWVEGVSSAAQKADVQRFDAEWEVASALPTEMLRFVNVGKMAKHR